MDHMAGFDTVVTNSMVEELTILLSIRTVPGYNLGQETVYPD
jgi:hypothetical protein